MGREWTSLSRGVIALTLVEEWGWEREEDHARAPPARWAWEQEEEQEEQEEQEEVVLAAPRTAAARPSCQTTPRAWAAWASPEEEEGAS